MSVIQDILKICDQCIIFDGNSEDQYGLQLENYINNAYKRRFVKYYRQGPDIQTFDCKNRIELKLSFANPKSEFNEDQLRRYTQNKDKYELAYIIIQPSGRLNYTTEWVKKLKNYNINFLLKETFEYKRAKDYKEIQKLAKTLKDKISLYTSNYGDAQSSDSFKSIVPPLIITNDKPSVVEQITQEVPTDSQDINMQSGFEQSIPTNALDSDFMSTDEHVSRLKGTAPYFGETKTKRAITLWIKQHLDSMCEKGCKNNKDLVRKVQHDMPDTPQSDRPGPFYIAIAELLVSGHLVRHSPHSRIYAVRDKFT